MPTTLTEPLPPPVAEITANRNSVLQRYPLFQFSRYRVSRATAGSGPISHLLHCFTKALRPPVDTPSASLYRMYEFLIADWTTQLRNELEYFCRDHPCWAVADIPDPADPDSLRYAVLAVLTKLMCIAFNRRIDLGLLRDAPAIIEDFDELAALPRVHEHPPEWASRMPPLSETVFIPDENGNILEAEDVNASVEFRKMNIVVREPHIHFV